MATIKDHREAAYKPTRRRMERDRDRASPRVCSILTALLEEDSLFDPNLQAGTLLSQLGFRDHNAGSWFAKELGKGPWAYITDARLEVGARLLERRKPRILAIASTLGYAQSKAFSDAFKRWDGSGGRSPKNYSDHHRAQPPPSVERPPTSSALLESADGALAVGAVDAALAFLARVDSSPQVDARIAVAHHGRGSRRAIRGDVDRAFEDLRLAAKGYALVDPLPPIIERYRSRILEPVSTDAALNNALCHECRRRLLDDAEICGYLRRGALGLVPQDLAWFRRACGPCYIVVWDALSRARLGLLPDAWMAWWLSRKAAVLDPETPPSLGRYIAALTQVERLAFGDQAERRRYSVLAIADAEAISGDAHLKIQAHIWNGSVLRAMARLVEARAETPKRSAIREPWILALHDRMSGILETESNNYPEALDLLRSATELYKSLDLHTAGRLLIQQGAVLFYTEDFEQAIRLNQLALSFLDSRRDPLRANADVPLNLAFIYAGLERWDSAEKALSRCCFEREAHPGLAATESFTRACLKLGRGRPQESLVFFFEARRSFEGLHRFRDVALAASYSVEAHVRLRDRNRAIESAETALKFFQAAGCVGDSLKELGKLRALLEAQKLDVKAIAARVRRLAKGHGGWLLEGQAL
jgi:AraC-like DNA-binding protein